MRRLVFLAAFVLVTASCGHPPRQVQTRDEPAGSSIATSAVAIPLPMLQSAAGEAVAEDGFLAALAAAKPVPVVVARPKPRAAVAQLQAVSQPCGGWEREVDAAFGAAAPQACRVMACESGGNPGAYNRSGATGLFQLMEVHADRFVAHGWTWADARDGDRNIVIAAEIEQEQGWAPWVCRP